MKSSIFLKGLAVSAVVIAMCVFQSQADTPDMRTYTLGGAQGPLTVVIGPGDPAINNPNAFPVVYVEPAHFMDWGFLLDGSELSKSWLKTLQDACANNKELAFYIDYNLNNGYGGQYVPGVGSTPCRKICGITLFSDR